MKQCRDCQEVKPVDEFFWVSRASGRRRGQCKGCMMERKREQRDPDWTPACNRCGGRTGRREGSGQRLCDTCLAESYDLTAQRENGSHRLKLKPCTLCDGPKERGERGRMCVACKPWAGYAKSLRRFGLTPAEYVAILESQGGVCYLCAAPPNGTRLSIDHDHAMPEGRAAVRGLLCNDCNYSRLPKFDENAKMLRRAADYLDRPPARKVLARVHGGAATATPMQLSLPAASDQE